ncbi:ribonuclease HII [Ureibacillus sp. 179-F W5.1 NHS]|uniref:Ribonuclease HII n=1 Tax=Lysinibacillus halotolerans TaxID=1368476 RepID=A0A3M8HGW6_9BACI|nr:ribonuclease HII [Lysinibacillus halotolerans]RND01692.1 ribonuclease HII [Lysinibacillus halotolerans]
MTKTVKEITEALQAAKVYASWMKDIEKDERAGVQKAWKQWVSRREKEKKKREEHEKKIQFDRSFLSSDQQLLVGLDEAGRGPLAGPVVTAAVILPKDCEPFLGINDSKQLSKKVREEFAQIIKGHALAYSIHFQSAQVIDEINIYEATKQSMKKCVESLTIRPDFCIVDALVLPIDIPQQSIIKGDAKSLSIAAASILAKNARDEYMEKLHLQYPAYGFDQNAGYGTKQHLEALKQYGPIKEHRKSFEPIKSMMESKERLPI